MTKDDQLEQKIDRQRLIGTLSNCRSERIKAFNMMKKFIAERSLNQIAKMEKEIK